MYSGVQLFVLLYIFMFLVSCCNARYDFRIKMMFGSYLPQLFAVGFILYLCLLCLSVYSGVKQWCQILSHQTLFCCRESLL